MLQSIVCRSQPSLPFCNTIVVLPQRAQVRPSTLCFGHPLLCIRSCYQRQQDLTSKNGVYKVTFFDENYSFYFQDFPSKLPNSWILARAYSILSGVLDSRRVRFSKRYHDAPNTATKILSDKTMILFSHFIFAVPSYHLVLLALEFIHNFNFPLPFCSLHSLFVFQLYSSTANLIMVHIIL